MLTRLRIHALIGLALSGTATVQHGPTVVAQEAQFEAITITATGAEDGPPATFGFSSVDSGGGAFSIGGPLGGSIDPNNRSQLFDLLSNVSVRSELKLTEEQIAGVQQIIRENGKRMQEQLRTAMADRSGNITLDIGELIKEKRAESEAAIEEILLPEQLKRVRQLAYQIEVATEGLGESLINGRFGRDVGVYDDQKQHLTDRAKVIEQELRTALAKVHAAARAKLFAELTPDQRKEAENLLGDYFQYERTNIQTVLRDQKKATVEQEKSAQPTSKK